MLRIYLSRGKGPRGWQWEQEILGNDISQIIVILCACANV